MKLIVKLKAYVCGFMYVCVWVGERMKYETALKRKYVPIERKQFLSFYAAKVIHLWYIKQIYVSRIKINICCLQRCDALWFRTVAKVINKILRSFMLPSINKLHFKVGSMIGRFVFRQWLCYFHVPTTQ